MVLLGSKSLFQFFLIHTYSIPHSSIVEAHHIRYNTLVALPYILFILGFFVLIKGAGLLVDGAAALARRLGILPLVIGLTVVAFGTSAPELTVNLLAALHGSADLAVGNIIGSNIANILFILGAAATIYPLDTKKNVTWRDIPIAMFAAVLVFVLSSDVFIGSGTANMLSRIDGIVLLSFFVLFLYYTFSMAKRQPDVEHVTEAMPLWRTIVAIVFGLIGLIVGGKWIVDGALAIAGAFGISEGIIGLTIVAIGTSLPELASSLVAAAKKQPDIAVGNIVGSNIFNIFLVLGVTASVSPLQISSASRFDMLAMVGVSFLLFGFLFAGKRGVLDRWKGLIFVLIYIVYIASFVLRV